ncbi:MAG: hypothetical protein Q7U64_08345, partial [Desulfocapsaceae bacterium]|nr:hypothetical protein [Desulfocapsaceae bacterium]
MTTPSFDRMRVTENHPVFLKMVEEIKGSYKETLISLTDYASRPIPVVLASACFRSCQSAFKNDPLSASKNAPPKVKKRSAIPPRNLRLATKRARFFLLRELA